MRISNQNIEMLVSKDNKKPLVLKSGQNIKAMILELQSNNIAKIKIGGSIFSAKISTNGENLLENTEMKFQVVDQENGIPILKVNSEDLNRSVSKDLSQLSIGKDEVRILKNLMENSGIRLSKSEIETILKDDKSFKFLLKKDVSAQMEKGDLEVPKTDSDYQKNVTELVKKIIIKSTQVVNNNQVTNKTSADMESKEVAPKTLVGNDLADVKREEVSIKLSGGKSEVQLDKNNFTKEVESFKGLFKEIKNTIEIITLATKGKVPPSLENIKGMDSLFNKNGAIENIIKVLSEKPGSDELKEAVNEIKNFTHLEKFANINNKKAYLEKLGSDIEKVLDLVEKEQQGLKSPESRELKSVVEFMKAFNETKEETYYYNVPFKNKEDDYSVDMLIKRDKGKNKGENEAFNILISLDTKSLGQINSIVKMESENISIHFKVIDELVKDLVEDTLDILRDRLEKNVAITVGLQSGKGKFEEILEFISNDSETRFDLRI